MNVFRESGAALGRVVGVAVFGAFVGTVAALGASLFVTGVEAAGEHLAAMDGVWWWWWPSVLAAAGLAVSAIIVCNGNLRPPHGLADVILSVQALRGPLPFRGAAASVAAAFTALGAGVSVGLYGPMAHFGATLGSLAAQMTGEFRGRGNVAIACGVAAAIATAFNAPIAGVLFAHEVILRHTAMRAFAPVTVAAVMGTIVDHLIGTTEPLIPVSGLTVDHDWEFPIFAALGVGGAVAAMLFMAAIFAFARLSAIARLPLWAAPAIAGLVTGCVALAVPEVLGIGLDTVRATLAGAGGSAVGLTTVLVSKLLVTALCLGFGFVGGVFSPSLFIGVMFGSLFALAVEALLPGAHSAGAVYAICGLVAVVSPVIGAPMTAILIVFELTGSYDVTIAAMVSVVFSNLVSYRVFGRSFFDRQLVGRGIDLSLGRDRLMLSGQTVSEIVSRDCVVVRDRTVVADVHKRLVESGATEAFAIDDHGMYRGSVHLIDLIGAAGDDEVGSRVNADRTVLEKGLDLWSATERLQGWVGVSVPVVESRDRPAFVGVLPESAVIERYIDVTERIKRDEN